MKIILVEFEWQAIKIISDKKFLESNIIISLDFASTEFFHDSKYYLKGEDKIFSSDQMVNYLKDLKFVFVL